MFTGAFDETHSAHRCFLIPDERSGNPFFAQTASFFFAVADLDDGSAVVLDASGAGKFGMFVGIHILDVDFWRKICILIQRVLSLLDPRALIEVSDGCGLFKTLDDFGGLFGKAITLVGRGIKRLVVAVD